MSEPCSICGFAVAWLVDKGEKETYWLCGECAAESVWESFLAKQILIRVARAAQLLLEHGEPELYDDLEEALKEAEHLL